MTPDTSSPSKVKQRILEKTRNLVMSYGWNATAHQLVNPGISLWFARAEDAVVGYVEKHRIAVVAGAPVCSRERLGEVVEEWSAATKGKVCYFGAAGRLFDMLHREPGYSCVALGAQPVWNPQNWRPERSANLRQQFNRARNKGIEIEEWEPERASNHPDLKEVLEQWLASRGLPPLHFLVEPQTLGFLEGRRIFVAVKRSVGQSEVVGFLVLSPIPVRSGWLTEQFVRGKYAPNGTVELLVDAAIRAVARDGSTYATMGLVPLSTHANSPATSGATQNPLWLRFLMSWTRAHGRRFYNFGGLESFKAKFMPDEWEPIYVVSHEARFSFGTLYAIAAAFTQTSPVEALFRGFGKALRQEWRWIQGRR